LTMAHAPAAAPRGESTSVGLSRQGRKPRKAAVLSSVGVSSSRDARAAANVRVRPRCLQARERIYSTVAPLADEPDPRRGLIHGGNYTWPSALGGTGFLVDRDRLRGGARGRGREDAGRRQAGARGGPGLRWPLARRGAAQARFEPGGLDRRIGVGL